MAKGFSIMDMMSEMSREGAAIETEAIEKVSVFDIQPNEDNFYEISNIEQLKNSIYAMGGVQQNLLLVRLPVGGDFKYKALAGHRRTYACLELVKEGHKEFEYVPAVIRENIDRDTEEMLLVMTNSTQRELTDWEKVMQHMKLKEIIPKLKKRQGLDGKTRALEADYLGVSEGQIAIYNMIGTKLHADLMDLLKRGCIGISLAYEAAKLEPDLQEQLAEMAHNNGSIYEEDIKQLVGSRPIEGQLKLIQEWAEEAETEKVTDSDTLEKAGDQPIYTPPEKQETCYDLNEGDAADNEKVTESVTFDEHLAAVDVGDENEGEKQEIRFRGGYEPFMIDDQISKYEEYLKMALKENIVNLIWQYNCLLDALDLLKARLE